jgi:hypothetical protein
MTIRRKNYHSFGDGILSAPRFSFVCGALATRAHA